MATKDQGGQLVSPSGAPLKPAVGLSGDVQTSLGRKVSPLENDTLLNDTLLRVVIPKRSEESALRSPHPKSHREKACPQLVEENLISFHGRGTRRDRSGMAPQKREERQAGSAQLWNSHSSQNRA